ncbi:RimK family alpha-L-glutamate ligase, partial [Paraburkholderia sp. BR10954]
GLKRLGARGGLLAPLPSLARYRQVAYLQRFVAGARPGFDWRVLVIGGKAVAAMRRSGGKGWIHNVAQGARCEAAELTVPLAQTAVRATVALGLDYAGVDLIPNPDDAALPLVLEVNGVAAWRGLQSVVPLDVAAALVDDLLDRKLTAQRRAHEQAEQAASAGLPVQSPQRRA